MAPARRSRAEGGDAGWDAGWDLPVVPPVEPMLARLARALPAPGPVVYEPKWDGFRGIVFRSGDRLEIQSRSGKPLVRYFPELRAPLLAALPDRAVVDGELVVAGPHGLDFAALSQRQHPAESRVRRLAVETPAAYVAFDLLALGTDSWLDEPFSARRAGLEAEVGGGGAQVVVTPATDERARAREWYERFAGAGLDGVMVKPRADPYQPGRRSLTKVKHEHTADCVVAGYRTHRDGGGVGSLLLGLHDAAGVLHHVGVAASLGETLRTELRAVLEPLREGALDDHPWADWEAWADPRRGDRAGVGPDRRLPGSPSRWSAGRDASWTAVHPVLVAEVAYDALAGDRFRHNARFRRFRPDRDPESCRYDQLWVPPPVELAALFGG